MPSPHDVRTCTNCGTIHSAGTSTVVYGTRFRLGPHRYRSIHESTAPARWTREEAERDYCKAKQEGRAR